MAHTRIAKLMLLLFSQILIPPVSMFAQYTTTYTKGVTDATSYATTKNLWYQLKGGGQCAIGTLLIGPNSAPWCAGVSDHYPYSFSQQTQSYTKQTAMGLVYGLAVDDANKIWALRTAGNCTNSYGVFKWTGSVWTRPNTSICLNQLTIGTDGFMAGILNGATPANNQLFQSADSGVTWPLWSTGWTYIYASYNEGLCGVDGGHNIFLVTADDPAVSLPRPSSTITGCAIAQDDPVLFAWDATHVYLYNATANTWSTVAGLAVSQIVALDKSQTYATDSAGHPYHWNVYPKYAGGHTYGTWTTGCPNPQFPCNTITPSPTHTGVLRVYFPHSINGTQQTQTINWNADMNLSAWDANPQCDLFVGASNDPECQPTSTGHVTCNTSHATLYSDPPIGTSIDFSEDFARWNTQKTVGPTLPIGPNEFETLYTCGLTEACEPGTRAACPVTSIVGSEISTSEFLSAAAAQLGCVRTQPWGVVSVYDPDDPIGACTRLLVVRKAFPIPGMCY